MHDAHWPRSEQDPKLAATEICGVQPPTKNARSRARGTRHWPESGVDDEINGHDPHLLAMGLGLVWGAPAVRSLSRRAPWPQVPAARAHLTEMMAGCC
jgi:hypothetical protein